MSEENKWETIPNGGFPNIRLKSTDDSIDLTKRQQLKNPSSKIVNITEILQKKRHADPYLPFSINTENKKTIISI